MYSYIIYKLHSRYNLQKQPYQTASKEKNSSCIFLIPHILAPVLCGLFVSVFVSPLKLSYFFRSEKGKEKYVLDALPPCERDVTLTVRETGLAGK